MRKIILSIMFAASLVACCNKECDQRNANTQNPIMPILYSGSNTGVDTIYLTDYLPQAKCFDSLVLQINGIGWRKEQVVKMVWICFW
jgi:uncharacterized alpha/beta hydrolase family protein